MKAKEYLNVIRRKRLLYEEWSLRVEELEHQAQGLKAITYDKDRVQTSPANKTEEIIIKLESISEKYRPMIDAYEQAVLKAIWQIDNMPKDTHKEILLLRYMTDDEYGRQMTFERISCIMHKSYEWVCHLHGHALTEFERRYKDDMETTRK